MRTTTTLLTLVALAGALGVLSCGGDSPSAPDPNAVASITVTPAPVELNVGGTVQLTATLRNSQGQTVTAPVSWSSANTAVATVSASGLVSAVAVGTTVVTASADGRSGSASIIVSASQPPLAPSSLTAAVASQVAVDLSWTDNSDNETSFVVEREDVVNGVGGGYKVVATPGANVTTYRDQGLTSGGTYRYRVKARNGNGDSAYTSPAQVTTQAVLSVATQALRDGYLSRAYADTLKATGGSGTYQWSVKSGTLPAGVTLSAAGIFAGTPTAVGSATFTVAVESGGQSAEKSLTLTVLEQLQAPQVVTTALPSGTVGVPYSAKLEATKGDGSYTWSLTGGTLPAGLSLAPDGTVAGTPTVASTASLTVQVQSAGLTGTGTVSLTVAAGAVIITTSYLPAAQVGAPYATTLTATGGDGVSYTWSLVAGTLPAGLTLAAGTGVLSGTPTTAVTAALTLQATSGGRSGTKELLLTVMPASSPGYDISLVYQTSLSSAHLAAFESARSRWEGIITADLPDEVGGIPDCGDFHPETPGDVDDVVIYVTVDSIDGVGGTLGQAGPCWVRDVGYLPVTGAMKFDAADLDWLATRGLLVSTILHEMGHVLGFGTVWTSLKLTAGECLVDPSFTGPLALAAFNAVGGSSYSGAKVPLENTGTLNDGSNCVHWREAVFGRELMTPALNSGVINPLSIVTVQSMGDMGYTVSNAGADGYALSSPSPAGVAAVEEGFSVRLMNDLLPTPILSLRPDGSVRVIRPAPTPLRR